MGLLSMSELSLPWRPLLTRLLQTVDKCSHKILIWFRCFFCSITSLLIDKYTLLSRPYDSIITLQHLFHTCLNLLHCSVHSKLFWQTLWHSHFRTDFWKEEPLTSRFGEVIIRSGAVGVRWSNPLIKAKHIRISSLSHPSTEVTHSVKIATRNTSCGQNI